MAATPDLLWEETRKAIAELRARDSSIRDSSCFELPTRVGPFELAQMCPREALALWASGNPVFHGVPVALCSMGDVAQFLRVLSVPKLLPAPLWREWVTVRVLTLWIRNRARQRILDALTAYRLETFLDWPTGGGGGDKHGSVNGFLWSHMFHLFARTYGWAERDLWDIPLRRLFIYRKHILADYDIQAGRRIIDTSKEEMRLKDEYMRAKNAEQWGGIN